MEKYVIWLIIILTLLLFAAAILAVMLKQAKKLRVREEDFSVPGKRPVRFALIADIHVSRLPIEWERIISKVAGADPDFTIVAGDLVCRAVDAEGGLAFMELLAHSLTCPIYVTFGNHEEKYLFRWNSEVKENFTEELTSVSSKICFMENRSVIFEKDGRRITIYGLPDLNAA